MVSKSRPAGSDLVTEVGSGDRRRGLEALRDELAQAMLDCSVGVKAQIAGQLRAVIADLDGLPSAKVSVVDDLAGKRKARRAKAKMVDGAGGGIVGG